MSPRKAIDYNTRNNEVSFTARLARARRSGNIWAYNRDRPAEQAVDCRIEHELQKWRTHQEGSMPENEPTNESEYNRFPRDDVLHKICETVE